jgi:DNA-3-methyladenine glycosylase II
LLDETHLRLALDQLATREPAIGTVLASVGYETLLRTIVGQQVSVAAAASVWAKLEALLGEGCPAEALTSADFDALRGCGLSRQKQGYARSLADLVTSGALDLHALPGDDEDAIALLTQVKGIGRWSAEIYLLFAEQRPDIWPAGDLAVQYAVGTILGLDGKPDEKTTRALAEPWRPYRGAMAIMAWHHYNMNALG